MGAYPALRRFTPSEYLRLERAAELRSEYIDGQIYAMAGGTLTHDRIVMNATFLLQSQLRGGRCEVHSSELRIAVSKQGPFFYPDLSVICGEIQNLDTRQDCVLNPSLIVEVQSKSTRKYDREVKVGWYQQIPALQHILLLSQTVVFVEHHFRNPDGDWAVSDRAATLRIGSLSVALPLAELYDGSSVQSIA